MPAFENTRRELCLRALTAAFALAHLAGSAQAQGHPEWDDEYFMTVTFCQPNLTTDCSSPANHQVIASGSDDGSTWTVLPYWGMFIYNGSVPDIVRRGNTVYVFTPNEVARYNVETEVWTPPVSVTLTDPATTGGFVDPSVYIDQHGRIVLFYLLGVMGQDPAGCSPAGSSCTKYIHSAVEVPGSDGTAFVVESGDRLTISTGGSDPPISSDPEIIRVGDEFIVLLSRGTSTQLWTSPSLHGTYTPSPSLPGGYLWQNGPAVASGLYFESTGEYWFYAHEYSPTHNTNVIRRAVVSSITSQIPSSSWTTAAGPNDFGLSNSTELGSPGICVNSSMWPAEEADRCPQPSPYCVSSPNSAGPGAELSWSGSTRITENDFHLDCAGLPAAQFGLYYYGANQVNAAFGDGYRCVGGTTHRFNAISTNAATQWVDFTNPPTSAGEIAAASTWNFQFWFRDPAANATGFNLSDALEVTFCP